MQCVTPENHKVDQDKQPISKTATEVRPADSHYSGSPAAQRLCSDCADIYDKKIQERQQSFREQRKKDLEKKRIP